MNPGPYTPTPMLSRALRGFSTNFLIRSYGQLALLYVKIRDTTPGSTPTTSHDTIRHQTVAFSDPDLGAGYSAQDPNTLVTRYGYLSPVRVSVGRDDKSQIEVLRSEGVIIYQGPSVTYAYPVTLTKGDVLIFLTDLKRFVVGDELDPTQVLGATVLSVAKLEDATKNTVIQSLPLN